MQFSGAKWLHLHRNRFKIAGGRHIENVSVLHISPTNYLISRKFGVNMRFLIPRSSLNKKKINVCKSSTADGRHVENRYSAISAPYCWINAKFGGRKISNSIACRYKARDQNGKL